MSLEFPKKINANNEEYKDYNGINYNILEHMILYSDFSPIYRTSDVNIQIYHLNSILLNLFACVPVRTKRHNVVNNISNICNNEQVREARYLRDLAYRSYCENKNVSNWIIYCKFRNRVKKVLRKLKSKNCEVIFRDNTTWKVLNNIGCSMNNEIPISESPDTLNNIFVSNQCDDLCPLVPMNDSGIFSIMRFNETDLQEAFFNTKSNSVGVDELPIKFLKIIYPSIEKHILHIFNTIIMTSTFPLLWKTARVVPIRKTGGNGADAFRPISILSCLSKVFERLVVKQINCYLTENKLLSVCHSGYRKGFSTTTLLLSLTDRIRYNLNNQAVSVLIALDLSKAFDTINHDNLINKLNSKFNFRKNTCRLIQSYLSGRSQFVSCENRYSSILPFFWQ